MSTDGKDKMSVAALKCLIINCLTVHFTLPHFTHTVSYVPFRECVKRTVDVEEAVTEEEIHVVHV